MSKKIEIIFAFLNTFFVGIFTFYFIFVVTMGASLPGGGDNPYSFLFAFLVFIFLVASIVSGWKRIVTHKEKKIYRLLLLLLTLLPWLVLAVLFLIASF